MGEDELRGAKAERPGGARARTARDASLGQAVLCVVVVALGIVLALQGGPSAPTRHAAPDVVGAAASGTDAAQRLLPVADAVLLRAEFSVVPGLQVRADDATAGRPSASVSAPLLGASALRPGALVLPSSAAAPADHPPAGLSATLWNAYEQAARRVSPQCHLPTSLLAAIGDVESSSLAGRSLDAMHNVVPPVLGPRLDGGSVAAIRDTDGGRWDGDQLWDRAVGPMQFIPGTWRSWGSDGNGDGVANPQNLEDATYSAARYLCAGGRDLARPEDLRSAILSYNRSASYLARVLELMLTITPGSVAGVAVTARPSGSTPPPATYAGPPPSTSRLTSSSKPDGGPQPSSSTSQSPGVPPTSTGSTAPRSATDTSTAPNPPSPTAALTGAPSSTEPVPTAPSTTEPSAGAPAFTTAEGESSSDTPPPPVG